MKIARIITGVFVVIFLLSFSEATYAYSPSFFSPYKAKVKGFENRLSLKNILDLTAMPSSEAQQLLLKAGYKQYKGNQMLIKDDYYAHDTNNVIYSVIFNKSGNTKGFKNIIIFTQPEMRIIQTAFLAGGYTETHVVPRKGARWTKVYEKKGYPTYSISMMLLPNMDESAQFYDYDDYTYCLICEKR